MSCPATISSLPRQHARLEPDVPVFLHCMWRTGGTYLFSRFREEPRYYCYYEPLHEALAELDEPMIRRHAGADVAREMSHPVLEEPYFAEYRPLLAPNGRGVRDYEERFAIRSFFKVRDRSLVRYLTHLLQQARHERRQPVLKFCRSIGRMQLLRRNFDAFHVYLYRNPRDQWESYVKHCNPYYMPLTCVIAALSRSHRLKLRDLLQRDLPQLPTTFGYVNVASVVSLQQIGEEYVKTLSREDQYLILYYLWRWALSEGRTHADFVVDIDGLCHDSAQRQEVEDLFGIRLVDCRIKQYAPSEVTLPTATKAALEKRLDASALFPPIASRRPILC
jgi:hypothetical protein